VTTICLPDDETAAALQDQCADVEVLVWDGFGPAPDGLERATLFVASYVRPPVDRAVLESMPELKVVLVQSAGVDGWLPRIPDGVILCGGRGVHGGPTAELALAAILSHLRELPRFAQMQQRGQWDKHPTAGLRDQRLLVLGAGDIGARVATAARVFEADVTVVGRRARAGVQALAELPSLLPTAQIVVIALPDTPDTKGLVDSAFLAALPDGALIVNVARGPLVDTDALLAELRSGRLYAFLDVFETEPLPAADPLWSAPNLVLTPHIGGGTVGWERHARRLVHEQVANYLAGRPLANVVEAGY
jgi:phosphoglycerate dehydrogenase-like enzyme